MTGLAAYPEYKESGVAWAPRLPAGWADARLSHVSTIYAGGTPDRTNANFWTDGTVPWLNSGSVNDGIITSPSELITQQAATGSSTRWAHPGSVVVALAGQGKTKAMAARLEISSTFNQSMAAIVAKPGLLNYRFLHHWLTSNYQSIRSLAGGDLRDGLNLQHVGSIQVPLPPLAQQIAIADFLDRETAEIDAFIADQEELIGLLIERRAATITHAVTRGLDPSAPMKGSGSTWFPSLPADWRMSPIGLVTSLIQTGPFGSQLHSDEYVEDGVPLINPMHIVDGTLRPSREMSVTEEKATKLSRHSLRLGDVIVARRGELGRCAVTTPSAVGYLCGTGSAIIRLKREVFSPEYFQLVFSSEQAKCALLQFSVGSTMENLNSDVVAALKIPCPPLHQQQTVVEHLRHETAELDAAIADAREAIALSKERRAALISAAVTGKIDVRTVA